MDESKYIIRHRGRSVANQGRKTIHAQSYPPKHVTMRAPFQSIMQILLHVSRTHTRTRAHLLHEEHLERAELHKFELLRGSHTRHKHQLRLRHVPDLLPHHVLELHLSQ